MMTLDETMLFNNMTNAIKNLEQSKSIRDIIDDLNKLILTLGGRKHDIIGPVKAVSVTHVVTNDVTVIMTTKVVPVSPFSSPMTGPPGSPVVGSESPRSLVADPPGFLAAGPPGSPVVGSESPRSLVAGPPRAPAATGPPTGPAAGPPSESKPVQKQAKAKTVTKAPAPAPGRGKVECRCGLMICNAAMSRHEKGAKHKEAMAKKQKTEMKQAEGQALGMSDMDLVDIDTYMKVMLPRLYKKVRGLGGQAHNNETFGFMKIEGDRDEMIDTISPLEYCISGLW
jgi:hypothetical protein